MLHKTGRERKHQGPKKAAKRAWGKKSTGIRNRGKRKKLENQTEGIRKRNPPTKKKKTREEGKEKKGEEKKKKKEGFEFCLLAAEGHSNLDRHAQGAGGFGVGGPGDEGADKLICQTEAGATLRVFVTWGVKDIWEAEAQSTW